MALVSAWERSRVVPKHEYFDTYEIAGEGTIAVMPHGYGIHKASKFTANAIFEHGIPALQWARHKYGFGNVTSAIVTDDDELFNEPRALPPAMFALYNEFYWISWNRRSQHIGAFVTRRSRMQTPNTFRYNDAVDYVGTGRDITKAWDSYIPVIDREKLLTRACRGLDLDRLRLLSIGCGTGNQLVSLAAHGFDVYGIEGNPNVYRDRHYMLRDRIVLGDALQDLFVFTKRSFNIVSISCVGHVWYGDLTEFLAQAAGLVCYGGLVTLDIKEYKGREFRDRSTYRAALAEAGVHVQLRTPDMLIGVVRSPRT